MTTAQRQTISHIKASLETTYTHNQAAIEGAALAGELGIDAQIVALSAQYLELRAAGKLDAAAAVKAQAIIIKGGT